MTFPGFECGAASETGPVRDENQDAVGLPDAAIGPEKGYLFAIADGMGGYANGALASHTALEALYRTVYGHLGALGREALRQGLEQANLAVFKAAQQLPEGRMGTTLTALLIVGRTLHLAHVGDCRAYLVRGRQAVCLTRDHTQVGELVRAKIIAAGLLRTHPQRSILTRSVGLNMFVQPEFDRFSLQEKDRLILCSDGLWSVIEDDEIARMASEAVSAEQLSRALIDLGLARGSDDNLTALSLMIDHLPPAPERGWLNAARGLVARRWFGSSGKNPGDHLR